MKEIYFSFFGYVLAPEGAEVLRLRREDQEEWKKIERRLRGRRPIWQQEGGGLYAQAYRTRRRGTALLIVECPLGGWIELGEVVWPLKFVGPAMVAGACCSPRYGLKEEPAGEIARPE